MGVRVGGTETLETLGLGVCGQSLAMCPFSPQYKQRPCAFLLSFSASGRGPRGFDCFEGEDEFFGGVLPVRGAGVELDRF